MRVKYISVLIITLFLSTVKSSPTTKDLILGRSYVVPADTPEETFNLLRLGNSETNVQQILYAIFTPIQAIISTILNLICSLIPSVTSLVETLREAVLENLISILNILSPILSVLVPEIVVTLEVIQVVLDAGNQLLYNGTTVIQEYGCTTILSINDAVTSIVNTILGVF